jgi:hypothetical protein
MATVLGGLYHLKKSAAATSGNLGLDVANLIIFISKKSQTFHFFIKYKWKKNREVAKFRQKKKKKEEEEEEEEEETQSLACIHGCFF